MWDNFCPRRIARRTSGARQNGHGPHRRSAGARLAGAIVICSCTMCFSGSLAAQTPPTSRPGESLHRWATIVPVQQPAEVQATWIDFVLTPRLFTAAKYDLSDLRLYDARGQEVPFALRVLNKKSEEKLVPARLFNRTQDAAGVSEVSLELEPAIVEHNELRLQLPGRDYRRRAELEGSDDGSSWRPLQTKFLVDFTRDSRSLRDNTIAYPPSRFRYLRLRLDSDPVVDKEAVSIEEVIVVHRIELPGEELIRPGTLKARQAVPTGSGPGSSWVVELGGDQVPVSRLELEVADTDFVRNYTIEAGGPEGGQEFQFVTAGVWRRRSGQPPKTLMASFTETRAARMRVTVTDNRNPPLQLESVSYAAAARQVVYAPQTTTEPLKLYVGNPDAQQPGYDFARNLPEKLEPPPGRASLGTDYPNPEYSPLPLPLTERWPWLIYVVLSLASLVLVAILLSLSRTVIAQYDTDSA